ncbi:MAG TPA: sterol desaturase family protein [Flavisolibacter sp.]|nr:sterol desaturase family protein [Flavisolibacter sp.]
MNLPTPLDIFRDPLTHYIAGMYAALILWEAVFPARKLVEVKYWKIKGIAVFLFYFFLSSYLPLFINPYLEPYRLFNLSSAGVFKGAVIGTLLYEAGVYVWHRAMHRSDFLWKTFHQMHHSAERLDTYGAFFFSPLDMIGWTVLSSICFTLVVGLAPQAIVITLLVTNFLSIFQHANINTPQWLGYIVQRPESHTEHHAKNIHAGNYSDLPLFDILFGTFKNPKTYSHETGFYNGASGRVKEMLLFKDVSKPASLK